MIRVGPNQCKRIELTIPWRGCWEARAAVEGKALSGAVQIDWRGWILNGFVDPARSGLFADEPSLVIVGGYGWTTKLDAESFTDDRGILAGELATTIAGRVGQTITIAQSVDRALGKYFAIREETAGQLLTRLFGVAWYVATDGSTFAGPRPASATKGVTVLNYEPRDGRAELYADRPDQARVGATLPLDARLKTSRRITRLHVCATGDKERIYAQTEAA